MDTTTTPHDLLHTSQAARLANVSAVTIRAAAKRGELVHVTTAQGERLFYASDVEAYRVAREARRSPAPQADE